MDQWPVHGPLYLVAEVEQKFWANSEASFE